MDSDTAETGRPRDFPNGNPQGPGELLDSVRRPVESVCRALMGDRDMAEEAAQQAMANILEGLPTFQEGRALRPWALQIARNAAIDLMRRRGHARLEDVPEPADPSTPVEIALKREESARTARWIAALPPLLREAVVLKYAQGLPNGEIQEILGIGRDALWQRLSRARKALARRRHDELRPDRG